MSIQEVLRKCAQIVCICGVFASANALDLRKDLSNTEFQSAGLQKLNEEELAALQSLIDGKKAAPAPSMPAVNASSATESDPDWKPAPPQNTERTVIETEVTDSFKGLFGNTIIKFANGQVWQQTDRAKFDLKLRDRRVRIKPAIMGRWRLQFLDNNQSFVVKRIQ